ncbi:Cys-Gln thioester bond-forming surface protein [Glycomyces xiaoerkulensis]|uniref:Cys-Gln thioester bond-forming surface protein n=1 Tax=Glycomyces xiaoerkulensis TaxID=2038139 RepID=UPI0018E4B65D|nr:Cys-Gln thioester bond-forming surface protein [Glycomyces xiaoerkulensis]
MRLAPLAAGAAAALVAIAPGAATAQDDDATVTGDVAVVAEGLELRGDLDGDRFDVWANVLGLTPHDSDRTLQVYCIDIRNDIDHDATYAEGDWDSSGVPGLEQVRWVLVNGHPNTGAADLLERAGAPVPDQWDDTELTRVAYAGTQAAVWHFTDGFEPYDDPVLGGTDAQQDAVTAVYDHLVDNAGGLPDPSEFYIDLEGVDDAVYEDGEFGPYTIRTNAGPVTLDAEGGRLLDADGGEVTGLDDGDDFYIVLDEGAEQITIGGHAVFDLPVGRVFLAAADESLGAQTTEGMTSGPSQKLILAENREAELPAEWAFALELPDTETPPEETSPKPQLPTTGTGLSAAFAAGLALVIGGLAAIALVRRRAAAE